MYKNITKLALVSVIGIGTIFGATQISSAAIEYDSKAQVKFVEDTSITEPVDPDNPDPTNPVEPVDPIDPNTPVEPGTEGPLSIDYISNFYFGEVTKSGNEKTYEADLVKIKDKLTNTIKFVAPYAQVTDNRGTLAGWNLQVKQESQLKTESGSTLDGAQITLKNSKVNTIAVNDGVSGSDVVLDPASSSHLVVNAKSGFGGGTFTNSFGEEAQSVEGKAKDVILSVPAGIEIKDEAYTANLKWTLIDGPQ